MSTSKSTTDSPSEKRNKAIERSYKGPFLSMLYSAIEGYEDLVGKQDPPATKADAKFITTWQTLENLSLESKYRKKDGVRARFTVSVDAAQILRLIGDELCKEMSALKKIETLEKSKDVRDAILEFPNTVTCVLYLANRNHKKMYPSELTEYEDVREQIPAIIRDIVGPKISEMKIMPFISGIFVEGLKFLAYRVAVQIYYDPRPMTAGSLLGILAGEGLDADIITKIRQGIRAREVRKKSATGTETESEVSIAPGKKKSTKAKETKPVKSIKAPPAKKEKATKEPATKETKKDSPKKEVKKDTPKKETPKKSSLISTIKDKLSPKKDVVPAPNFEVTATEEDDDDYEDEDDGEEDDTEEHDDSEDDDE